ncbi:MAG: polymer-forming cytoskeletal protein [Lewinella sp.]|nr:polymer-forming cytoskeletal protein [Lewinella sp.]
MFGKEAPTKKETGTKTTPASGGGHSLNSIVEGTTIEGTIKAESDIRIDGAINGKLFCSAKVIIGPTGSVEGEIRCDNAVIEGKFQGTLSVKELLNIRETATVDGDVTTGKLIVQPGGVINGTCNMGGKKPEMKPLSSNNPAPQKEKEQKVAG